MTTTTMTTTMMMKEEESKHCVVMQGPVKHKSFYLQTSSQRTL